MSFLATAVIDDAMNGSAFGGCNRFRGQVQPSGLGLAFPENMAGTMMARPDEIEAQERRFLDALAQVSDYVRYGAGIVMEDFDGRAVLHFFETPE
ncbi:META domain-containing protein [Aestuariicoccus sp. MJ-SS9]|uniref:META domain-containing protein n=1 Tax=Aestuariicoccus sp. MJ-SS9 TaxID=3079855 RepID=UPI0029090175|nr:META domain-containing protein [Aestuariicoccus sp. MJ-SS9]MDU8912863.1 META domain-containing protein [Aestuariicoccus sp. MJ-SS9]